MSLRSVHTRLGSRKKMFKAVNIQSDEDVIILHPKWTEELDALRSLDRADALVCQGCKQPVRLRAGTLRRWHFAHKHRRNCPYGKESPALLLARAALYRRLIQEFGECVTLEKRVENPLFPRPVDCWVERPQRSFAFWIADTHLPPQVRTNLVEGFNQLGIVIQWVFTAGVLQESQSEGEGKPPRVHLSTTERELMRSTYFDVELDDVALNRGKSLHYLDPEAERLTTYRSLRLVHAPQTHEGRCYTSALSEVVFAPKTGDLAHPGERTRAQEVIRELQRREQEREARQQALAEQQLKELQETIGRCERPGRLEPFITHRLQQGDSQSASEGWAERAEKEGTCVFCGTKTRVWVSFDGTTGSCKCRACYRLGRY